jgi:hypothetical protein
MDKQHQYSFPSKELSEQVVHAVSKPSDINHLLPAIIFYAMKCKTIVEMGVRTCVSTYALLATKPELLICIDIHKHENVDKMLLIALQNNITAIFREEDTLKTIIPEVDMLFIDTLHIYSQLKQELEIHHSKVKKYILLHDTETYGHKDEPTSWQTPAIMENYKVEDKKGLMPAVSEFLENHKEWVIAAHLTYSNGLTIIQRQF